MKNLPKLAFLSALFFTSSFVYAQQIETLFNRSKTREHSVGAYGAISNKFTRIDGKFASMGGIYGGVYINHAFTIGVSASALNNNLRVPEQYSKEPSKAMSYFYGQAGLFTEYVMASNRTVHLTAQLTAGPGVVAQYKRWDFDNDDDKYYGANVFAVVEPGVNAEINLLRWMRLTTGVSYRQTFNSKVPGLSDKKLSGMTITVGMKFGKF